MDEPGRWVIRHVSRLLASPIRRRWAESWLADYEGAEAAGMRRSSVVVGAVIFVARDLAVRYAAFVVAPAVAVLFLTLWIMAEVGRGLPSLMSYIALAIVVGAASAFPNWSVLALVAVLMCQLSKVLPHFGPTDWPAYLAVVLVVGLAALSKFGWLRPGLPPFRAPTHESR